MKKFCYRGSVHDLSFKAPLARVSEFQELLVQVASEYEYPAEDIGGYVLPLERGRAMHCEFDFHCDHADVVEREAARRLWQEAGERLVGAGAFFDRPYGPWAEMMYSRSGTYARKLQELKKDARPEQYYEPGQAVFLKD